MSTRLLASCKSDKTISGLLSSFLMFSFDLQHNVFNASCGHELVCGVLVYEIDSQVRLSASNLLSSEEIDLCAKAYLMAG
jgi:hypothetical protein